MAASNVEIDVLGEDVLLDAAELARACDADAAWIEALVAYGVLLPARPGAMVYSAVAAGRLRKARRLQRDFELNPPGVALVLELLDEIERLRRR